MFPLFCNKCFRRDEGNIDMDIYFSKCDHVFCKVCVGAACHICGVTFEPRRKIKDFTSSSSKLGDPLKILEKYQTSYKFHAEQEALLANYYVNVLKPKLQKCKDEIKGLKKADKDISDTMENVKGSIAKMNAYLVYHQARLRQGYEIDSSSDSEAPETPNISDLSNDSDSVSDPENNTMFEEGKPFDEDSAIGTGSDIPINQDYQNDFTL